MIKERHWGISVLSVLGYIGSVVMLLIGIALIAGASAITSALSAVIPQLAGIASYGTMLIIIAGVICILMAVLEFFMARGLWKGQNWARILTVIFAALGVLTSIWPFSIVNLIISGLIFWYLGFYKPAVAYFK